jgi:folate-dependent phosphoribosylglycinamide formyltransferase PurN
MRSTTNRIAILCGPKLRHLSTCSTIIKSNVHVVGICICNEESGGLPIKYIWRSMKKKGAGKVFGQILGRMYYNLLNKRKDQIIHNKLYNEKEINEVISDWNGEIHYTTSYSDPETIRWLENLKADIFVVHTGSWVGKKIRELPKKKIVIGGHPGLTPKYRGSHSAFWAIYNGHPEDVGCSIFWLDGGVDTGDLIKQEKIKIEDGDSFVTLGWKGMIKEADMQAKVIREYQDGIAIPRIKYDSIPEDSYYDVPTLFEYLRYRKTQKGTR